MRKLKADEIECRVAQVSENGCSLLLYKTARVDRAILDEEFGCMNWQNDFKVINGNMYGGIGIKDKETGTWVWKWDCGTESNTEAEKGQASDCFKRAGFKWGIGVELYTAPFIFLRDTTEKDEFMSNKTSKNVYKLKKEYKYIKYQINEIGYADNGDINKLIITDDKGNNVYTYGIRKEKPTKGTIKTNDADYYIAISKITDRDALISYYEMNKGKVNNQKEFHELVNQRAKALKELEAVT